MSRLSLNVVAHQPRSWTILSYGLLAALVGMAVWMVRPALGDIIHIGWRDPEQTQILLAPVVAAWLLWLRRNRLPLVRYQPSVVGPIVIGVGWFMTWYGFDTDTRIASHVGAMIVVLGAIVSMIGVRSTMLFAPVLGVFLFAIPIPGTVRTLITLPLQDVATTVTYAVLDFVGISVQRSGYLLLIDGTEVNVGEACNGMRMVLALAMVVYAFVFSIPLRPGMRVALLALSPVIALACNVIRLVPTALVYGYFDQHAAKDFHDYAGWVMLPIALGMLFGIVKLLRWLELPVMAWRLSEES